MKEIPIKEFITKEGYDKFTKELNNLQDSLGFPEWLKKENELSYEEWLETQKDVKVLTNI